MPYYIDSSKVSLEDLRKRIEDTDLVPSRASLLDGIDIIFKILKQQEINTLTDLRKELKKAKNIPSFSKKTGIDTNYLSLLRREIESYFPKPSKLKEFDWLSKEEIAKLESSGIKDIAALYNTVCSAKSSSELAESRGIDIIILDTLFKLADLTRIQWVNHTVARMLLEAGYNAVSSIAEADAEDLCKSLMNINEGDKFYKGNIGLRDIKRLVKAASYVRD